LLVKKPEGEPFIMIEKEGVDKHSLSILSM